MAKKQGAAHDSDSPTICIKSIPWLPLLCGVLLVVSIPVWFVYSTSAAHSTQQAIQGASSLQAADLTVAIQGTARQALSAFSTIRTVALVLLLLCLGLLAVMCCLETAARCKLIKRGESLGPCGRRSVMTFSASSALLLWVALLAVVVLLALTTTWFLGAWASSALLQRVTQYSSDAEQAAKRAVDSAMALVSQVQASQLEAMDKAPPDVKGSQWFKDFRKGVQELDTSIVTSSGAGSSTACEPGCISIDLLAGLAGLDNNCICLTNTFADLQGGLHRTKMAILPALIGLVLVYLAASWLLIYSVASYVSTKWRILDQPDASRPPGLTTSVDAAIDIQSSGNSAASRRTVRSSVAGGAGFRSAGVDRSDQQYSSRVLPVAAAAAAAAAGTGNVPYDAGAMYCTSSHSQLFGAQRPVSPDVPDGFAAAAAATAAARSGSSNSSVGQQRVQQPHQLHMQYDAVPLDSSHREWVTNHASYDGGSPAYPMNAQVQDEVGGVRDQGHFYKLHN